MLGAMVDLAAVAPTVLAVQARRQGKGIAAVTLILLHTLAAAAVPVVPVHPMPRDRLAEPD